MSVAISGLQASGPERSSMLIPTAPPVDVCTITSVLPGTFAYAYLGQGVDSVLVAAQASGREAQISDLVTPEITLAFFALAFVALIPTVIKQIRKRGNAG